MVWLTNLPPWASFLIVVGIADAVAFGAVFAARAWYGKRGVTAGPPVVTSWATCLGALAAVLAAFTIITLWNIVARAASINDGEASAIRLVARDLSPSQLPILRAYVDLSAEDWRRMCGGSQDPRAVALLTKFQRVAQPRTPEYAADLFRELGALEDGHYQRWAISGASAPAELRLVLCMLAFALFGVLAIALPDRLDTHLALTVLVGTAFGTVFWVMVILSYPYCGSFAIGPDQILSAAQAHL